MSKTSFNPPDRERYPALFKRWLTTGEGKRWLEHEKKKAERRQREIEKHPNSQRPWSATEDAWLRRHWGEHTLQQLSSHLGRSQRAVSHRARHLELPPANRMHRGMSLREFSEKSGFSINKIKTAAQHLGIPLRSGLNSEAGSRFSKNRRAANRIYQRSRTKRIPEEDQERLLEFMLNNPNIRWNKPVTAFTVRRMWPTDIKRVTNRRLADGFVTGHQHTKLLIEDWIYSRFPCQVALDGDRVVGYVLVDKDSETYRIASLSVMKSQRRLGHATRMLEAVIERSEKEGMPLVLTVRVTNEAARALYTKMGFEEFGLTKRAYVDGEDGIEMIRPLP